MLTEIQNLNQKVFMLEFAPEDPGYAASNASLARALAAEAANSGLRAQLAAATALVEQSRAMPPAPSRVSPQVSHGNAADIRHPTLHRNLQLDLTLLSSAPGGDDFRSAHSVEEWYGSGPADEDTPGPGPQTSTPCPQYNMCGSGLVASYAGPPGVPSGSAPSGPPKPVFNAFQSVAGGRPPVPAEDPARFRPPAAPAEQQLRAPGVGGPAEFRPLLSGRVPQATPLSSQATPSYETQSRTQPPAQHGGPLYQPPAQHAGSYTQPPAQHSGTSHPPPAQQAYGQYLPPAGFHSFVSDYARSEAPPQETAGYGVESSDLESEKEDDPSNPAANAARRTKAARNWKLFAEFNGQLAIAAIPDNARGFKHWKDIVRADVAACSKAGSKAYTWILRVEDNNIPDETLKVSKRKWEPLDAKIRAALLKVATGEIRTMFELLTEEEHVRHRRQISGAYMLRMVYRRFQTKNSLSQFYDYADLNKVTLKGDAHLGAFLQE